VEYAPQPPIQSAPERSKALALPQPEKTLIYCIGKNCACIAHCAVQLAKHAVSFDDERKFLMFSTRLFTSVLKSCVSVWQANAEPGEIDQSARFRLGNRPAL
jgi:hypothetical protein